MRQKRAKTYKRVMALYTQAFNFRQPFQVLVANDLILETAKQDLDIYKQLSQCVQGETKPMITQCCMEALYKLGKEFQTVINVAKGFERRRCNHREAIEPEECLKDVVGATNKHRYILAIQSPTLLKHLQTIPALPTIHFNPRHVLVLSPPSTATIREKNKAEEGRRVVDVKEMEGVVDGENVVGAGVVAGGSGGGAGKDRGRKVKGVNPLSAKKKKTVSIALQPPRPKAQKQTNEGEAGPSKLVSSDVDDDGASREGQVKKRTRSRDDDDNGERGDGEGDIGEGQGGGETGGKRRKRKRRGKGVVADAIAEIQSGGRGGAETTSIEVV